MVKMKNNQSQVAGDNATQIQIKNATNINISISKDSETVSLNSDSAKKLSTIPNGIRNEKVKSENKDKSLIDLTEEIREQYKRTIKNELIIPWIYGEPASFDGVFPKLFIKPFMKSKKRHIKYSSVDALVKNNIGKNIIVTGDAGIGKSTLLKYIFLYNNYQDVDFLYIKAKDLNKRNETNNSESNECIEYIISLINGNKTNNQTVLLIDGIEEEFSNSSNIDDLYSLIKKISGLKNIYVWFGWRKEHLNKYRNDEINQIISDEIYVKEWNIKKAKKYVKKYAECFDCKIVDEEFNDYVKQYDNIYSFAQNPFQLTLLLYLIKNKKEMFQNISSISLFTLYNEFVSIWIKKEAPLSDTNEIIKKLTNYAEEIIHSNTCIINDEDSVIRDLFHFRELNTAYEFYHSSLAAFFIAKKRIDELTENNCGDFEPLMADVTVFIKNSEDYYINSKESILNYLITSYHELNNSAKSVEEVLRNKNGIVYLITRLSLDKNTQENFIKEIKEMENDSRMKVSIAYGAASLGLQETTVDLAKEFYNSDSKLDKATRSFSLVYYGDVQGKDFFEYEDDCEVSWKKSREIRLKNLNSIKKKDINFRILDIPLLYCFYKSREWGDTNIKDYLLIQSSVINKKIYCNKAFEFLNEKYKILKKEYLRNLLFHK